jgi:autotransporter adhesin
MSTNKSLPKKLTAAVLLSLFGTSGSVYAAPISGNDCSFNIGTPPGSFSCADSTIMVDDDRDYIDQKASDAETGANNYTDNQINTVNNTIIQTSIDDREYTDQKASEAESGANSYTDTEINNVNNTIIQTSIDDRSYTDQKSATAESNSNTYTDSKLMQANEYTDNRFEQSLNYTTQSNNKINSRIDSLNDKVDVNDRNAKAGIAGAMAMSAIPQRYDYKFNFGMAAGNYNGQQAMSAGTHYNVSNNTTLSAKISYDTQNNVGSAVGFAVGW